MNKWPGLWQLPEARFLRTGGALPPERRDSKTIGAAMLVQPEGRQPIPAKRNKED